MAGDGREMEPDSAVYKTLLESTKAIPWRIDWATMRFTYIGPQIEELLGWTPASWATVNDWVERMHPADRERVVEFCVSQSKAGVDHEADYRAQTRDGGYVWIRDVVHVVRKDGMVEALIGFMFDISERKCREQEMLRLQRELELLSYRDGLTNAANRRMFEEVFEREWGAARRSDRPLSVILLDIDFFKEYNDSYGHLAGDECLRRVADLLGGAARRPRDLVGRYGGEEFVVLLPETDASAAQLVAENCRRIVQEAMIPHQRSRAAECVTVSLGVSSIVPNESDDAKAFLEEVDRMLYKAKQSGRNRVELSDVPLSSFAPPPEER
jgi:diguanylate cyclase (GGDEF)-like protein/PAS domain S-box-containing protein